MTQEKISVSVIIPTYNREKLVSRSIQSVLDQTYQDYEIIVVDDASIDNTEKVVKSFNDVRIRFLRSNLNKGGSAARNMGIIAANGEYIAFLDSDDEWLPEKLEKQISILKNLKSLEWGGIYCGHILISNNRKMVFMYE